ncbi:hypothetical protein LTR56_009532 [Elasticomyces elasticus]|nr:hypothetical protein LTR56_009532 [Elasticomyces elasticus]KAK3657212.1 hypothetical protein LTR22_009386 [Elasticomyces elasticus]KAK4922241.1 hypothetical protein LTR49_010462 [Elasticomyces elasticus]KAK5760820.1 hypothetical protein LTS12_008996 [Elasticomyces elasticus]
MSKAAASPTARLLQNSRLFSLPRPLPAPALETITSQGGYRSSETATLPYPTHQAIATPSSSHYRGDWGLKRALPKKGTKSGTIRVRAQDNTEHITDFGSAADHTQTRAKWLEMGVPVWYKRAKSKPSDNQTPPPVSVFDNVTSSGPAKAGPRWKYDGPWLAGMQDGDFERFVGELMSKRDPDGKRDVKGRSRVDEFREFLKDRLVEEDLIPARREAQESGDVLSPARINELRQELRPSDADLDRRFKDLRHKHASQGLTSDLTAYITGFLDLPGVHAGEANSSGIHGIQTEMMRTVLDGIADDSASAAPPSTHPAAGLSYLRTNAIMENHPVHGPQAQRSPVLARVLRPRASVQGSDFQAKLGVAGIVANDPSTATFTPQNSSAARGAGPMEVGGYNPDQMTQQLEVDLEGGNKLWMQPQYAWIDESGRIRLEVNRGDKEAVAVKMDGEEIEKVHQTKAGSGGAGMMAMPVAPLGTAQNANFGNSLPDYRQMTRPTQEGMGGQRTPDYARAGVGGGQQQRTTPPRTTGVRGFDHESEGAEGRETARRIEQILSAVANEHDRKLDNYVRAYNARPVN